MEEKNNRSSRLKKWLVNGLGFYRNSPYVAAFHNEANVRAGQYMSLVIILLEIWMLLRYIRIYVFEEKLCNSVGEFFYYTRNYWILLVLGVGSLIYAALFLKRKIKRSSLFSTIWAVGFSAVCLYFGYVVSFTDYTKGRQFLCFLTMVLYVACLLNFRPFVSIIMLVTIGSTFLYWVGHYAVSKDTGQIIGIDEGDRINYITFFISLIMVAISIYHQRQREALKTEASMKAAITDQLTGVPNMNRFQDWAISHIEKHPNEEMIYLYFNIENFKTYNDAFGYSGGNDLLVSVGQTIGEVFLGEPFARQADDHFVVLTEVDGFPERIEKVRKSIIQKTPDEMYLDINVGGFCVRGDKNDPRLGLDRARYASSLLENHPNLHFMEYDDAMHERFRLRQYIINNIDKAVRQGHIQVYYQPVVWSKDRNLCSCEALARWIDPDMGFLSPGEFIPVLEECRQINKLDLCIMETVCRDMSERLKKNIPVVPTSINFSRLDFELMDAVAELERLVEAYRIPRKYIHVEITESALTDDMEGLRSTMNKLREKGYSLWLDDFGSGYSSMNVLKDYHFDVLKIDMVFLKNFESNENARKIIKCVIDLADALGMKTLMEGVETQYAADYLEEAGCGRLQGYYYGKPMPYADVYQMVEDKKLTISSVLE